jgi:hypothetical protein
VTLTVTVRVPTSPEVACVESAILAFDFPVALRAPLAGRRVLGSWSGAAFRSGRVPRLVGLSPRDTDRLLSTGYPALYERVRTVRSGVTRPVVRAQYPASGTRFPSDGAVRLEIADPRVARR